jgi:trk system potassium uptake protein TrkA
MMPCKLWNGGIIGVKCVVVGGGKVGYYLIKTLLESGHSVSAIETDPGVAQRLAEDFGILVINRDGADSGALADAGCDMADVVAAVTGKDEENLIVCQVAKRYFNPKKVIARVNNPKNQRVFSELGVDATVSSTAHIARLIEREVVLDRVRPLLTFERSDLVLVEVDLDETSNAVNTKVRDLARELPADCVLVAVIRQDRPIFPRGDTMLRAGDIVMAFTSTEVENALREALIGRRRR